MNRILIPILIAVFTSTQAQYSTYYNVDVNQNVNSNINKNVNVSANVYEHKTIKTIDYGALMLANAQMEQNRLENTKYADEKQRLISLEIASDPVKAYDYGYQNTYTAKGKEAKPSSLKKFTISWRVPYALFVYTGPGRFENVSSRGITTEVFISSPIYNEANNINVEETAKLEYVVVGQSFDGKDGKTFIHKKDVNRATVFGVKGYKSTLIYEDDFQYTISDSFLALDLSKKNGIAYSVEVNTYGDKDEVTFEELEGRRYYLRFLIEKMISTAVVSDVKYLK